MFAGSFTGNPSDLPFICGVGRSSVIFQFIIEVHDKMRYYVSHLIPL